jgi:hypothetical protein
MDIVFRQLRCFHMWRPLCRDGGSVIRSSCWASPAQSFSGLSPAGLITISCCINSVTLHLSCQFPLFPSPWTEEPRYTLILAYPASIWARTAQKTKFLTFIKCRGHPVLRTLASKSRTEYYIILHVLIPLPLLSNGLVSHIILTESCVVRQRVLWCVVYQNIEWDCYRHVHRIARFASVRREKQFNSAE